MRKYKKKSEGECDKFLSESNKIIWGWKLYQWDNGMKRSALFNGYTVLQIAIKRWNYSSKTVVIGITRNFHKEN